MITLTTEQIQKEATRINQAELNRRQIDATTTIHPGMTIADAYEIQKAWMDLKKSDGRKVVGHKIGLTSKTMQKAMNIDEPDFGTLLDNMVFENESTIEINQFLDPRIEVELAFVLKQPLAGRDIKVADVLQATEYVIPALELIAARSYRVHPTTGYIRTVKDTISDNAANAGIIVGGNPMKPDEIDLRWVCALLSKNKIIEESGVAAAVLNHPANGIAWLCKKYADYNMALKPGQIILSGSFTRPIKLNAGDEIRADFGPMGIISCQFKE